MPVTEATSTTAGDALLIDTGTKLVAVSEPTWINTSVFFVLMIVM
jgi:hypothetical protein